MKNTGGKLQVLPNEVYLLEDRLLPLLTENKIEFEILEQK